MQNLTNFQKVAERVRTLIQSCDDEVASEECFNSCALDLFALQYERNAPYRRFAEIRGKRPSNVKAWRDIPALPTVAFKDWECTTLPAEDRTTAFHSSGTTDQRPSRHFHSTESLRLYQASLVRGLEVAMNRLKVQPITKATRFLFLTPSPVDAPASSLVYMFETFRKTWGAPTSEFLGALDDEGAWLVRSAEVLTAVEEAVRANSAVFLCGTAFSFVHLLDFMSEHGLNWVLPSGSRLLETGGYKGRSRAVPKAELHQSISTRFGLPLDRIICEYGMSELSSQAYALADIDGGRALFRFPPWARLRLISPETGQDAGYGEAGLLQVFDLANVYSVMAVQTGDLAVLRGDEFELVGRASFAEGRGCSLMASA